ncbi:hypothetical protein [Bacteroides sp. 224]|uniref:hypothetical protein n=1 Tax=Bacteroides sp. 224 TaxID=2302936 RepID=UPI0013D775EC|nr:hypothetical protein [Bacteroides sp. 224]NDV65411.1 hypothetical protein [Bacteroides sp. 224]
MKKHIIYSILFVGFFLGHSCSEQDIATYSLTDERINFLVEKPGSNNPYPDELVYNINFGVSKLGEELKDTILKIPVETQGFTPDYARPVALKAGKIEYGNTPVLTFSDYEVKAGEFRNVLEIKIDRATVERDTATVFYLQFDYDKMDLQPGVTERSKYKIRITDYVNMDLVKMNTNLWVYSYSGYLATWKIYDTGYGNWSNTKARFIMTVTGVTDFSKLSPPTQENWETWQIEKTPQFIKVLEALKEYKKKSEADPNNYPPYYDETASTPNTWISFWDSMTEI